MLGDVAHNENRGKVEGIAYHNQLGHGIKVVRNARRSLACSLARLTTIMAMSIINTHAHTHLCYHPQASLAEYGQGGSWCTCEIGAGEDPPQDVCHLQFEARVGFKLVWCPGTGEGKAANSFDSFVLVDDDGSLLNSGRPTGQLPPMYQRVNNYRVVEGSKYAQACEKI